MTAAEYAGSEIPEYQGNPLIEALPPVRRDDLEVMQAMSSPHYKFASDKTAFRIIERVDGRPWLESSITPKNGGDALSPFVKIATRA